MAITRQVDYVRVWTSDDCGEC